MRPTVVSVSPSATLRAAAQSLSKARVGILAVTEGAQFKGLLSERDVVRAVAAGADPGLSVVEEAMHPDGRYVTRGDHLMTAIEVMLSAGIRHLPVVEDGEIVGIISMRDLAGALMAPPDELPEGLLAVERELSHPGG